MTTAVKKIVIIKRNKHVEKEEKRQAKQDQSQTNDFLMFIIETMLIFD